MSVDLAAAEAFVESYVDLAEQIDAMNTAEQIVETKLKLAGFLVGLPAESAGAILERFTDRCLVIRSRRRAAGFDR